MNSLWRAASDWYHGTGNGQGERRVREAAGDKMAQVKVDVLGEFPPPSNCGRADMISGGGQDVS
jgi:hypothetical protein